MRHIPCLRAGIAQLRRQGKRIRSTGKFFPPPGPATAGTDTSSPGPAPFVAPPSHHTSAINALTSTGQEIFSGAKPPDPQEVKKQALIQRPGYTEPDVIENGSKCGSCRGRPNGGTTVFRPRRGTRGKHSFRSSRRCHHPALPRSSCSSNLPPIPTRCPPYRTDQRRSP